MMNKLKNANLINLSIFGIGIITVTGVYVVWTDTTGVAGTMLWLSFLSALTIAVYTAFSYFKLLRNMDPRYKLPSFIRIHE